MHVYGLKGHLSTAAVHFLLNKTGQTVFFKYKTLAKLEFYCTRGCSFKFLLYLPDHVDKE